MEKAQPAQFAFLAENDEEAALIKAAQRDPAQFSALYDHWVTPIYRYLLSRLADPHAAEDLTSLVFLKALEDLGRYQHRGHFAAWLFAIARHLVADHYHQAGRETPMEAASNLPDTSDLLESAERGDQIRRLRGLMSDLSDADRELLRLRFTAGLKYAEIAYLLAHSEAAIKKQTYRILDRLRKQMEMPDD